LRAALAQQATGEGIGDRVHLLGRRDDVPLLLGCVDVYVCSSAAEGMSNALLEAMAAGLPIVATDVGDNAVVVRDNVDGCIVQANSEGPIADALAMLAGSPEVRHRLGTAARDRAKNYSFERTVRAYEDYYQSLVTLKTSANTAMSHPRTCHQVTVS
jgi:glycosyltransferase involved in cell wall biosynthesis